MTGANAPPRPDYFADWRAIVRETDSSVFARAGYGGRLAVGARPALLVVDSTYAFVGVPGVTHAESMAVYPNSCGPVGWAAVAVIRRLIDRFRALGRPVIYSAAPLDPTPAMSGLWLAKNSTSADHPPRANDIVDDIAPTAADIVIRKTKPSVFHGSPLTSVLVGAAIDTLIVTGGTTSGCVRATVVDAFSLNYPVFVVEDAVFDRAGLNHAVSLFDMDQKYAEVIGSGPLDERLALLPADAHGLDTAGAHQ
jgi:nicotinamidase-related amidase